MEVLLQSICTFAAVDGLRLVIGVGSLAVSAGIGTAMDRFHQDWIRVPMIVLALLGSSLNLMQIRISAIVRLRGGVKDH
jgi:hypothetical protein